MSVPLRDLIIVIPGIMGSVLVDAEGRELWRPGPGMATRVLERRRWVEQLSVRVPDDPGDVGLLAGVRPTGLADTQVVVPGLVRLGGYTELHRALAGTFALIEGDQHHPSRRLDGRSGPPPNYFRFAYDWRRDNRASALQLAALVEAALPAWRRVQPAARVVIIAHSMGGLVARWYLEGVHPHTGTPLDGWRNVRELITFGTPYRGSLNALTYLVDGYRKLFVDFSAALATFTSVHQLLPRYPAVLDRRGSPTWRRPAQLTGLPGLDVARAAEAYTGFHCVIDDGVIRHRATEGYDDRYVTPVMGFGHPTDNSAVLSAGGLELSEEVPAGIVPEGWSGGDGTVPLVSALPLEYDGWSKPAPLRYVNKRHGTMQTDPGVLAADVVRALLASQQSGQAARVVQAAPPAAGPAVGIPRIGLGLADHVLAGADVTVTVTTGDVEPGPVDVTVSDPAGRPVTTGVLPDGSGELRFGLPPGEYQVTVTRRQAVPGAGLLSAADAVAVIDPDGPGEAAGP